MQPKYDPNSHMCHQLQPQSNAVSAVHGKSFRPSSKPTDVSSNFFTNLVGERFLVHQHSILSPQQCKPALDEHLKSNPLV